MNQSSNKLLRKLHLSGLGFSMDPIIPLLVKRAFDRRATLPWMHTFDDIHGERVIVYNMSLKLNMDGFRNKRGDTYVLSGVVCIYGWRMCGYKKGT